MQSAISSRLRGQFVNPPSVTASLVALGPPDADGDGQPDEVEEEETVVIYVVGEVQRPGRYEYKADEPMSVLQALAMAGGPSVFAARKRIQELEEAMRGDLRRADPAREHPWDSESLRNEARGRSSGR